MVNNTRTVRFDDGRIGKFDPKTNTITSLQIMDYDLPSVTYKLDEDSLKNQVVRTVGGIRHWEFTNI